MRLVFIAGWMRSGTTLLAELIGSCPGALAVGELTQMWAALDRDKICSCGHPVTLCVVWGAVAQQVQVKHGIGPDGPISYAKFSALVRSLLRTRALPTLCRLRRDRPELWPQEVRLFVEVMQTVLAVVSETSGCTVIVESSKQATSMVAFGLLTDVPVTPLHLVRDPRAVAYSESRHSQSGGGRPHLGPPVHGLFMSATFWNVTLILCHWLGRGIPGYRLLRYERLAGDPVGTMRSLAAGLSLEPPQFVGSHSVALAPSHVVDGNPSRFGSRLREIQTDERWRLHQPRAERIAVTVLTAPFRLALRTLSGGK